MNAPTQTQQTQMISIELSAALRNVALFLFPERAGARSHTAADCDELTKGGLDRLSRPVPPFPAQRQQQQTGRVFGNGQCDFFARLGSCAHLDGICRSKLGQNFKRDTGLTLRSQADHRRPARAWDAARFPPTNDGRGKRQSLGDLAGSSEGIDD